MVASSNNRTIIHKVQFICMIISLAASRQLIVSSYLFAPRSFTARRATLVKNSVRAQSCGHHRRSLSLFSSNNPFRRTALLKGRVISSSNRSMSSLSMSAVERAPSATTTSSSPSKNKAMVAKLVSAALPSLDQCGERLRSGDLVSFPTETVYGLGCHALDPVAVQKVFDAKERPLSDPLIVHVTRSEDALELWAASSSLADETENSTMQQQRIIEKQALSALTQSFFPGPLTIVARAHPSIPQIIMANTGYVACRSPSHPVARALIQAAKVPIAAPSANKFGHVSPTMAQHVMDDLGMEDVWIVDPSLGVDANDNGMVQETGHASTTVCQVGVESTVAKIEMNSNATTGGSSSSKVMGSITILRHGAISSQSIREALEKADLSQYFLVSDSVKFTSEKVNNVAPGQTVKHYSPNVPCFMISSLRQIQSNDEVNTEQPQLDDEELTILSQSVIIDYGKRLSHYQKYALAYRDLSSDGNPSMAASNVFETLRWSETVEGAIRVFVPELVFGNDESGGVEARDGALVLAVKDKMTRAASAVVVKVFQ
mmetsp:Transcript_14581/g.31714  ORF Transcript_14581/g.31714 Transcript_14581/m.31714 type:complete len:545 (-) Transcript_14581:134-1768(-)